MASLKVREIRKVTLIPDDVEKNRNMEVNLNVATSYSSLFIFLNENCFCI